MPEHSPTSLAAAAMQQALSIEPDGGAAPARDQPGPDGRPTLSHNRSLAVQAADALALRRQLDRRELTPEDYVRRLDETVNHAPPGIPDSRLPSAQEILRRSARTRESRPKALAARAPA